MSDRLIEMIKLATEEAKNLKRLATAAEIRKLDLHTLNDNDTHSCIYGQLTGYCNSCRAIELINECCQQVYSTKGCDNNLDAQLNGAPYPVEGMRHQHYYSPIEMLIADKHGGFIARKKLIEFLKGETETLEF